MTSDPADQIIDERELATIREANLQAAVSRIAHHRGTFDDIVTVMNSATDMADQDTP